MSDIEPNPLESAWLQEEEQGIFRYLWLSFADPDKPAGSRFLGVVITRALGLVHAVRHLYDIGVNPGGQVLSSEIVSPPPNFHEIEDRLLSKDDLEKYKLI